ncbi:Bacterial type II secretion system protein F domain protein [Thalassoglobus neptunius]|uniref:Bacterial type II secretion system protein F domain protein n=1 Tax=Thalassoglobus neptunius TaxID=1938619 RepID=A0A5C5X220_9PLAN|nr:type II secretion system F family protein [Thalassoglobus neptunius]TWT56878.1 Bacterial type II secretion system protein F domain protein [Thalassoglobus neptunius]
MSSQDLSILIGFASSTLLVLIAGMTVLRARSRVRNISEVKPRLEVARPNLFRRSMAGAIPGIGTEFDLLERDLKRAGFYGSFALIEYLSARNTIVVLLLVVGGVLAIAAPPATPLPKTILFITLSAIAVAYVVPRVIVSRQASLRLARIQKGLPDALDIVRMCLSGGLGLRESLSQVSREIEFFHPDLAVELEVVRRHADASTMTKALKEFAKRVDADDVKTLATLLSQSEKTGTHVVIAVTEFADGIRRHSRQRSEEKANQTTIKMLFPVVICLAPPILILLLGPPMLEMRTFFRDAHRSGGLLDSRSLTEDVGGR